MKNIILCVLCFWCTHGFAGYVDDQILKYCKEFAGIYTAKHYGEDAKPTQFQWVKGLQNPTCRFSESKTTHKVSFSTFVVNRNVSEEERNEVYREASGFHNFSDFIKVGAIYYSKKNIFGFTRSDYIMYVAIVGVETFKDPDVYYIE